MVDWVSKALILPMQMAWAILLLPAQAVAAVLVYVEDFVSKKISREMKTAGKGTDSKRSSGSEKRKPVKAQKKPM